jgi:hypothetical protein
VGDVGPLVMGGQGSGIFSAGTMFRFLLNIISGGRSFSPRPSFFIYVSTIFLKSSFFISHVIEQTYFALYRL